MLFRLCNASASFQILINDVLQLFLNVFCNVYLDNIIIYLNTLKKYIIYVQQMLKVLKKAQLFIKFKKCKFHKKKIEFLKFIINRNNIYINFVKIIAVIS